jgi:DNA ligase-1
MTAFKPMLAGKAPEFSQIKFPVLATPKLDGIRCVIWNHQVLSRSLKPIPNRHIRTQLESVAELINYFDGELILPQKRFNNISSAVMSFEGEPEFVYQVFDYISGKYYEDRIEQLRRAFESLPSFCQPLFPITIWNIEQLESYEQWAVGIGFEGVMIRGPFSPYKYGRSTTKEGWLLKIKRFEDSEAAIIGFEELLRNNNPAFTGELGQTKRSHSIYGKDAGGTLGALVVRDLKTGVVFNVGTGLNDDDRYGIWNNRASFLGKIIKYKFQAHGTVDKPRSPVFLGYRWQADMS